MGKVIFINERVEINMDNIKFQVDSIIEEYTDGSLPIDPVVIAKKVGIPISQVNFKSVKGSVVLGGIKKNKENISIYINANDSMARKRFTIAHELGHYFLNHINNKGEFVDLHRDVLAVKSKEEQEANEFAGCLLMPEKKLVEKFDQLRKLNFGTGIIEMELSRIFKVSQSAMNVRLKRLNLK